MKSSSSRLWWMVAVSVLPASLAGQAIHKLSTSQSAYLGAIASNSTKVLRDSTTSWARVAAPPGIPKQYSLNFIDGVQLRTPVANYNIHASPANGIHFSQPAMYNVSNEGKTSKKGATLKGALLGALAGAIVPYAICGTHCDESGDEPTSLRLIALVPVGAAFGALIGRTTASSTIDSDDGTPSRVRGRRSAAGRRHRIHLGPLVGSFPSPESYRHPVVFGARLASRSSNGLGIEITYARSAVFEPYENLRISRRVQYLGFGTTVAAAREKPMHPYLGVGIKYVVENTTGEGEWSEDYVPLDFHLGFEYALTSAFSLDSRLSYIAYLSSEVNSGAAIQLGISMSISR